MQIRCDKCEAQLHGRDVNFTAEGPRCGRCGARIGSGRRKRSSARAELPPSIQVRRDASPLGTVLRIVVPWRLQHAQAFTQLSFVCLLFVVGILLNELRVPAAGIAAVLVLLVLGFFGVRYVNHTLITVAQGMITIRHRPIPWLSRTIDARSIEQLYVDRRPLAQHRFDYSVKARTVDGEDTIFFRSLSNPIAALHLEQCIEAHLEIVDVRVSGELRPTEIEFAAAAGPSGIPPRA